MEKEFDEINGNNGWLSVYQQIRLQSYGYKYTCKDAKKLENKNLNRYRDVNPYDHTRVRLRRGDRDYINASLVKVPQANRAYILTQGPLPNTVGDFWLMVWEQKTRAVIMLNKVVEKNTVKCYQYWPLGEENGGDDDIVMSDVGLKVTFVQEKDVDNYTIRKLLLKDLKSGSEREILQFHYTSWPDFGVPESPSAFLTFLLAVRASGALSIDNDLQGPPVVHCSAGIGRSGTFCLVDSSLLLIEGSRNPDSVNIQEMLLEMRKYRMGLIQTADQLRFSYLAVIKGSQMLLNQLTKNSTQVPSTILQTDIITNDHRDENGIKSSEDVSSPPPPLPPRIGKNESSQLNRSGNPSAIVEQKEYYPKESEHNEHSDIRKRQRKERQENTAKLVQKIKKKQIEAEERSSRRRLLFKQLSLGVVLLMSTGIIVYRYYLKD